MDTAYVKNVKEICHCYWLLKINRLVNLSFLLNILLESTECNENETESDTS
jgi:hypothetical protein